eukprot:TRINITY_DN6005_c0_g1_i2.p1 TRINITY_DN6005_c0_g1~~TRINITY_DN6005_c0_g1_i2.p1  ORF type:complete len:482 (+),score=98.77 TRINITY_DN6005_c0_g1_i2:91-1536(+)
MWGPDIEVFGINVFIFALGIFLAFIAGAVASGSGIGGGGFYIPIFVLIMGLNPHVAVPLSKITILGISIGSFTVLSTARHPTEGVNRPLIDYPTASVMQPTSLMGAVIGVVLNVITPAYLLIIFLTLVLAYTGYSTFSKGLERYRKENAEIQKQQAIIALQNDEEKLLSSEPEDDSQPLVRQVTYSSLEGKAFGGLNLNINEGDSLPNSPILSVDDTFAPEEPSPALTAILRSEAKTFPTLYIGIMVLTWVGMFLILIGREFYSIPLIRDSDWVHQHLSFLQCGSAAYWILFGVIYIYFGVILLFLCSRLMSLYKTKLRVNYPFAKGDVKWTFGKICKITVFSTIAGVLSAYLGIGGGMINGPVMLGMDILPQVAVATSSFMILWTASTSVLQYALIGKIEWTTGGVFFLVGMCAAIVGQWGLARIIRKVKRQSYISFILAALIIVSTVTMVIVGVWEIILKARNHETSDVGILDKICGKD